MGWHYRLLFAAIYLVGCLYIALRMLGGGHGTLIFVTPLVTVLAFGAAILLLRPTAKLWLRILTAGLVLFHYLFTLPLAYIVESGDGFAHTISVLKYAPVSFVLSAMWYVAGSAIFWVLFFRTRSQSKSLP